MSKLPKEGFVFTKENYVILLAGLALIILGLILMVGGGSDDPNQFNPEIFSPRRITVAPLCMLAGFVVIAIAIMKKPKAEQQ